MNTIENDKLLSFSTRSHSSHESKNSITPDEGRGANQELVKKSSTDDNLELSAAGQLLNQSATAQAELSRSLPETEEQASTLATKIRQQIEQMGSEALKAHSAIQHDQIDLLLRSASA